MSFKIGSLFDGSGGFPLAAFLCGGTPVWASEIEPYPIAVTKTRFPHTKHLGSVTDINGAEIEPVDVVTFGSPCQDLSVAGKRAGLKHEDNGDDETTRSGLFMEAVRIIREMREATNGVYPRFALWENVPGAFSSNKGEDFRIVLEELIKIVEPGAVMPSVPQKGWPYADSYCGDGWSLAYRVFDAQYWGVPQRRRRIYLVADFRGECAREVLFEREGVRGYFAKGGTAWESLAADAEGGVGAADCQGVDGYNAALTGDKAATLGVNCGTSTGRNGVVVPYTLKIRSGCEGGGKGALIQTDQSATLSTLNDQYLFQPVTEHLQDDQGGQQISVRTDGKSPTLRAEAHENVPCVIEAAGDSVACVSVLASSAVNAEHTDGSISPCLMARAGTGGNQLHLIAVATQQGGAEISENGISPTITAAAGMSGNNQPWICVKTWDARGNGDGDTANTITGGHENRITDYTSVVVEPVAYAIDQQGGKGGTNYAEEVMPTLCSDSHGTPHAVVYGIDHAITTGGNCTAQGPCVYEDIQATLKAGGAHAVAYAVQGFGDYKDATDWVCGVDCRNMNEYPELYPTLQAKPNGGQPLNFSGAVRVRYIVRRLTPTECARLQGFPDEWGHPDLKDSFTDEEYAFWLDVRNTHAAINGKAVKEYTEKQMLTWYNKLHTDSSEYKMWGNGIALPCALYVMQGVSEVMN